jgi:hypothetical protein
MWPFKKKEKKWEPKTDLDYFLLGLAHSREPRRKIGRQPRYTPSKIIQPKQLT